MEIDITNKELIDLTDIVSDTYAELLLQRQMNMRGVQTVNDKQQIEDLLFNSAQVLVKLNRKVHELRLCGCNDDQSAERMESVFQETFKEQIKTQEFLEHIASHGGFRVASPQSQTSYQPSQKAESKWQPELGKRQESDERPKKKRRQTP